MATDWRFVEASRRIVIQASKARARIMRYELTDHEWTAIRPMPPNKPRLRATGERPACPQRHLLGVAIRSTIVIHLAAVSDRDHENDETILLDRRDVCDKSPTRYRHRALRSPVGGLPNRRGSCVVAMRACAGNGELPALPRSAPLPPRFRRACGLEAFMLAGAWQKGHSRALKRYSAL